MNAPQCTAPMGVEAATDFLKARYAAQCHRFPLLRRQVSEAAYVRRNLRAAAKLDVDAATNLNRKD